jgi:hypothetical protein
MKNLESGWHDLPCGGSVKIENGMPVRISDGIKDGDDENCSLEEKMLLLEAQNLCGCQLEIGEWQYAYGEPDSTAVLTVLDHVAVE